MHMNRTTKASRKAAKRIGKGFHEDGSRKAMSDLDYDMEMGALRQMQFINRGIRLASR